MYALNITVVFFAFILFFDHNLLNVNSFEVFVALKMFQELAKNGLTCILVAIVTQIHKRRKTLIGINCNFYTSSLLATLKIKNTYKNYTLLSQF